VVNDLKRGKQHCCDELNEDDDIEASSELQDEDCASTSLPILKASNIILEINNY
jgi:hypothetical protein